MWFKPLDYLSAGFAGIVKSAKRYYLQLFTPYSQNSLLRSLPMWVEFLQNGQVNVLGCPCSGVQFKVNRNFLFYHE